jgi:hypothetical protein
MFQTSTDADRPVPTTDDASRREDEWISDSAANDECADPLYKRLSQLKALSHGWDGDQARPIREDVIQVVWDFLVAIIPDMTEPVDIVPLANGTLELEWALGNRILQFEFESPQTIHYLKWDSDRGIQQEGLVASDDMTEARSMLQWFAEAA